MGESVNVPCSISASDILRVLISIYFFFIQSLLLHIVVLSLLLDCHACVLREACCCVCQFMFQKDKSFLKNLVMEILVGEHLFDYKCHSKLV